MMNLCAFCDRSTFKLGCHRGKGEPPATHKALHQLRPWWTPWWTSWETANTGGSRVSCCGLYHSGGHIWCVWKSDHLLREGGEESGTARTCQNNPRKQPKHVNSIYSCCHLTRTVAKMTVPLKVRWHEHRHGRENFISGSEPDIASDWGLRCCYSPSIMEDVLRVRNLVDPF